MRYVSLFSGIEAASVAWELLGWEPMAFAEIDPFPCAVLKRRYPNVPNLGDVSLIDWGNFIETSGRPDVLVGGSPCQSFSIAGNREGLSGASGLMFEYVRAVQELLPRWFVWENVPGALSVEGGAAFGQLLAEMADSGYGLAWRVLDAQFTRVPLYSDSDELVGFFGPVAQRRRRLFLVGSLGDERACEVLFEPESMRGDTLPSRAQREKLAGASGRDPAVSGFKYHAGYNAGSIGYEPEQAPTITADWRQPAVAFNMNQDPVACLESVPTIDHNGMGIAYTQNTRCEVRLLGGDGQVSGALCAAPGAKQQTYILQPAAMTQYGDVAGTLSHRYDSSPCADRGQNVVCCMAHGQAKAEIEKDASPTLTLDHEQPIAIYCVGSDTSKAAIDVDFAPTLHVGGVAASSRRGRRVLVSNGQDHTGPLCARDYKGVGNEYVSEGKVIATCSDGSESSADLRDRGMGAAGNWIYPVTISDGSKWVVRRLTPTECERLMGFPDGWTDIGEWEDEKGRRRKCADGNRYKALGNSMAVTVMMWLGARIQMVESLKERL